MKQTVLMTLAFCLVSAASYGSDDALQCDDDFEAITPLLRPGAALLVGEVHGTNEIPEVFGELICHAANTGHPVAIGLEVKTDQQASMDTYINSAGSEIDRNALLENAHWKLTDGRSSTAMMALLERIRQMKQAGMPITLFLFDDQNQDSSLARERAMASHAAAGLAAAPDAVGLLLTGNVHAMTRKGAPWDDAFEAMGFHLKKRFPKSLNIFAGHAGGTAWICTPECKVHELPGKTEYAERGVDLHPENAPLSADVVLRTGPVSASPQARK